MLPAVWLGRFLGAVLAECAPVIISIIKESTRDTIEDGATRDDLRNRLLAQLPVADSSSVRDAGGIGTSRGASPVAPADPGQNLGGG